LALLSEAYLERLAPDLKKQVNPFDMAAFPELFVAPEAPTSSNTRHGSKNK
jgi:hypothetical protein